MQTARTKQILNDLMLITNDRINDYEKAIRLLKNDRRVNDQNNDCTVLFEKMIAECKSFSNALNKELPSIGPDIPTSSAVAGSVYSAWLDLKQIFFLHHGNGILNNCEAADDAAQKAFKNVLLENGLPAFIRSMIIAHNAKIKLLNNEMLQLKENCCAE